MYTLFTNEHGYYIVNQKYIDYHDYTCCFRILEHGSKKHLLTYLSDLEIDSENIIIV